MPRAASACTASPAIGGSSKVPRIDVACGACGHIAEVVRPLADWPATPACPACGAPTSQIHLPPRTTWTADPVVVYRAPDGSYRFPGDTAGASAAAYSRIGYERLELRSAAEVRAFERSANAHERSHLARKIERQIELREAGEHARRSELHHLARSMSPMGRALAAAAMARNDAKAKPRVQDPGLHVDVYSNSRGSRDESRGPDGRRRRD